LTLPLSRQKAAVNFTVATTTLDVHDYTRRKAPGVSFLPIAQSVLPGWDISLVFVGKDRAKALNQSMRKKDYTPNVLSYVVGEKSGEIIICLAIAEQQAPSYGLSYADHVAFLFIHGLYHLKGLPHGATMERLERVTLATFARIPSFTTSTHGTTHRNRH
jgi:probable rRNA maturation factor